MVEERFTLEAFANSGMISEEVMLCLTEILRIEFQRRWKYIYKNGGNKVELQLLGNSDGGFILCSGKD
ncbi:hypothetical protein V1477_000672 [Vespula maculifrons]|uniref:Uncharacterized protein n=1 Tax=Vespula maculifrons TaxID=7453 RepID=A0ABD2D3C6_VESMC